MNVIKKTSNQPSKKIEQRDKEKRQYTHDNGLSEKTVLSVADIQRSQSHGRRSILAERIETRAKPLKKEERKN